MSPHSLRKLKKSFAWWRLGNTSRFLKNAGFCLVAAQNIFIQVPTHLLVRFGALENKNSNFVPKRAKTCFSIKIRRC
jgi:hypothetical protein